MNIKSNKLKELIQQITRNCHKASAGQIGLFSLCGMLLRLRQLFKWEQGLSPWHEAEPAEILPWIENREEMWSGLEDAPFERLVWGDESFDPFDLEFILPKLLPCEFVYGAGYGRGMRPSFFLGELKELRHLNGLTVMVLGKELARDLNSYPGIRQGANIFIRKECLAYYLWDQLADPMQQKNPFLQVALRAYEMPLLKVLKNPQQYQSHFQKLLAAELEALIHHELGEAKEASLQEAFPVLLELFPHTKVEHWVRALKDALAETNEAGRLQYLIAHQHLPSLALMLAWRPGFYPLLLPELEPAFHTLLRTRDWQVIEEARIQALNRLRQNAVQLSTIVSDLGRERAPAVLQEIEVRFLKPLGLK